MFSIETLELNQVLNQVARYCFSDSGKQIILSAGIDTKLNQLEIKLDTVYELSSIIKRFGNMPFKEDFDIFTALKMLGQKRSLSIEDILTIRLFLSMEQQIISYSRAFMQSTYQHIVGMIRTLIVHDKALKMIDNVVNIDGEILDHASTDLLVIRKNLRRKEKELQTGISKLLVKYQSYLNESLVVMRSGRYVIPVKETYKHRVKGVIHDISASGQTIYIEPDDIRSLTQEVEMIKAVEKQEIIKILEELSANLSVFYETLISNLQIFVTLDAYHAKALYGLEIDGIKPSINEAGLMSLRQARHPLISKEVVVPIDIIFDDNTQIILITGPNTGGKTVALKTLGLLTLMMQSGLLIPAHEGSVLSVFKRVFADIGDEQSIEQSLSTFSSHLTKIKSMIDHLGSSQLILLDEVGSGTDPQEGVALAIAILNRMQKYPIKAMVTTHYSELKLYALEHSNILNASVAFNKETLKPLYKLQLGVSGMSHALSIAKKLGLDEALVKDAQANLGLKKSNLSKMLDKFNEDQQRLLQKEAQFDVERESFKNEQKAFYESRSAFERQKEQTIESISKNETKKWQKLQDDLSELIKDLEKREHLSLPEISKAKAQLKQGVSKDLYEQSDALIEVGDRVYIKPYQQEGIVKKIKKKVYSVSLGQFDLDFKKEQLRKIEHVKEIKKIQPKVKLSGTNPEKTASMELDLRGVRYEEVAEKMDFAIDRAILANFSSLRIIHGFGTGAVRTAVYAYIKKSPHIASYRYGGEGEGLNGVTIITLH